MKNEKKWEKFQLNGWKKDKENIVIFFNKFNLNIGDIYDHILIDLPYDKVQPIIYLISKIRLVMKICDFLDKSAKKNNEDVDVIKIYLLISHAEITMNNLGSSGFTKQKMVENFFKPVQNKHKLDYKIKLTLDSVKNVKRSMSCAEILYKIRCEYAHEGNYTGRIFRRTEVGNLFDFKDKNSILLGTCDLNYQEFIKIFMKAVIENIEVYAK